MALTVLPLLLAFFGSAEAADIAIDVGDDWCASLAGAAPGDRLLFAAGTHSGSCSVVSPGAAATPVVLTSADLERRAVLTTEDTAGNLLDVQSGALVLDSLDLGPTPLNVEGVRLQTEGGLTIIDCTFTGIGGAGVAMSSAGGVYTDVRVEGSRFESATGAAISVGCAAGAADCSASGVVLTDLSVVGGAEGIVLAPDVQAEVSGITVSGTSGVALSVGGGAGTSTDPAVVVEGSHVAGLVRVTGGGVVVRNNVLSAGLEVSSASPLTGVQVLGNTLATSGDTPLAVTGFSGGADLAVVDNALWAAAAPGAPLPDLGGATQGGNVSCSTETACFEALSSQDPSPRAGGELSGQSVGIDNGLLTVDLCGEDRSAGGLVGALVVSLDRPLAPTTDLDPAAACPSGGSDSGPVDSDTGGGGSGSEDGTGTGSGSGSTTDTAVVDLPRVSAGDRVGDTGGIGCTTATGLAGLWLLGLFAVAGRRQ